jgi:8-oxo-dGTP pyrophosphatase MutT (NUDIX family)
MDADHIIEVVNQYTERFPSDASAVEQLVQLISASVDVTSRKEFRGHITCGAIVLRPDCRLLMIHHLTLEKWLFPGGHIEAEDFCLREAAIREVVEETGLSRENLQEFQGWFDHFPIQIDAHEIPANLAKGEPSHKHFDFRFLFGGVAQPLKLQTDEVSDWAWVSAEQAPRDVYQRLVECKLL